MSKQKTPDLLAQMIVSAAKKPPQETHEQPTNNPQKHHKQPTEALQKHHIRLLATDWNILKDHFQDQGLTVSAGIRQVLRAYIKKAC